MKAGFHWPGAPNRPSLSKESAHLVTLPAFRTIRTLEGPHYRMITCYSTAAAAAAKSLQSSLTLCDPINGSPPGSPVPGILQARTLHWVAISFSNAWKWKVKVKSLSHVRLFSTPWTTAYQVPPSMGVSRQEYWSGEPLPSPRCKLLHMKWINNKVLLYSTENYIQYPIILPFHTVHGVLKARILKWFAIPFSSGRFVRTLRHDLSVLGGPTQYGS